MEAGQRADAHLTEPSTDRPTNGIRPKNTTASDRKIVQRAAYMVSISEKSESDSDRFDPKILKLRGVTTIILLGCAT